MIVDHTAAVFDADFTNHICETRIPAERICGLLAQLLQAHTLWGVMHPLVCREELLIQNACHKSLFSRGIITVVEFADIFQGNSDREAYYREILVPQLYRQMNGKELPEGWDVLNEWESQQNLGEIHSIAMCMICGCGIFLSDDADSKRLQNLIAGQMTNAVKVYDRSMFLKEFGEKAGIRRSERIALAHKR